MKLLSLLLLIVVVHDGMADDYAYFEAQIRPLLVKHCYDCHNSEVAEGNLRVDLRDGLLRLTLIHI